MTCGSCIRWRRIPKTGTRFGVCRWPAFGAVPYWLARHPTGDLLVADVHGADCAAFKLKKAGR